MYYSKEANIAQLEQVRKFYEEQQVKVLKEKLVEQCLLKELVEKIKMNTSRYDDCYELIRQAQSELLDKDKRKKKDNLKRFERIIKEDFFGSIDFKIKEIVHCGMCNYGWQITFEMKDKLYHLQIPDVGGIDTETVKYAYYGKFVLFEQTSCITWTYVFGSYLISDVAKFISDIGGQV